MEWHSPPTEGSNRKGTERRVKQKGDIKKTQTERGEKEGSNRKGTERRVKQKGDRKKVQTERGQIEGSNKKGTERRLKQKGDRKKAQTERGQKEGSNRKGTERRLKQKGDRKKAQTERGQKEGSNRKGTERRGKQKGDRKKGCYEVQIWFIYGDILVFPHPPTVDRWHNPLLHSLSWTQYLATSSLHIHILFQGWERFNIQTKNIGVTVILPSHLIKFSFVFFHSWNAEVYTR